MQLHDRMSEVLNTGQDLTVWVASWIDEVADIVRWAESAHKYLIDTGPSDTRDMPRHLVIVEAYSAYQSKGE